MMNCLMRLSLLLLLLGLQYKTFVNPLGQLHSQRYGYAVDHSRDIGTTRHKGFGMVFCSAAVVLTVLYQTSHLKNKTSRAGRKDDKLSNKDIERMRDPFATQAAVSGFMSAAQGDVNKRFPPYGRTALIRACDLGRVGEVRRLINIQADVNISGIEGSTALSMAANWDNVELVGMLIGAGAEIDSRDDEGSTPLMVAAYNGNRNVVKLLLDSGADVNAKNNEGYSPAGCAKLGGHGHLADLLPGGDQSQTCVIA